MSEPFIGEIRMFAGNFAPRGWALCDGQLLAVSQNDALFSLLGTIYGGDGRTTFGIPEMRGRIPVHEGTGPGLSNRNLGARSGAEDVTLTLNNIPSHTHPLVASTQAADETELQGHVLASTNAPVDQYGLTQPKSMSVSAITGTGGGQSHPNMMPFLAVNFIIALAGVYPSRS